MSEMSIQVPQITPLIHHPVLWASAAGVFAVVILAVTIHFKAMVKEGSTRC